MSVKSVVDLVIYGEDDEHVDAYLAELRSGAGRVVVAVSIVERFREDTA